MHLYQRIVAFRGFVRPPFLSVCLSIKTCSLEGSVPHSKAFDAMMRRNHSARMAAMTAQRLEQRGRGGGKGGGGAGHEVEEGGEGGEHYPSMPTTGPGAPATTPVRLICMKRGRCMVSGPIVSSWPRLNWHRRRPPMPATYISPNVCRPSSSAAFSSMTKPLAPAQVQHTQSDCFNPARDIGPVHDLAMTAMQASSSSYISHRWVTHQDIVYMK